MSNAKVIFKAGAHSYEAELRNSGFIPQAKKPRAFIWNVETGIDAGTVLRPIAEAVGAQSIYTARGEFPALDKAWDAYNASIVLLKRSILDEALAALSSTHPQAASWQASSKEIKFSRKAGCRCGCSPGFVLPGLASHQDVTLFVQVAPKAEVENG